MRIARRIGIVTRQPSGNDDRALLGFVFWEKTRATIALLNCLVFIAGLRFSEPLLNESAVRFRKGSLTLTTLSGELDSSITRAQS